MILTQREVSHGDTEAERKKKSCIKDENSLLCFFPPPCRPKGETQKLWIYAAFDRMRSQDLWDICQAGGKERGGGVGVENEEVEQEGDRWLKVEELRRNLFWTSVEKTKDKGHGDS